MPAGVLIAVLVGAALHASWNVLVKGQPDKLQATALLYMGSGLIAACTIPWLPAPARASWPFLGASVIAEVIYGALLAHAYRAGDLSHAYPVMRGTAPLIVAVGSYLIARESLSGLACTGIALVSGGILSLVASHHGQGSPQAAHAGPTPTRLALINAFVIATYTLIDGLGIRAAGHPVAYIMWLFLLTGLVWTIWLLSLAGRERRASMLPNLPRGLGGGACSLASYGIALWAMTLAPIAAIAAVRETSIVFGVILGRWVLKERITPLRAFAAMVVTCGVILIRLGGT